MDQSQQNFLPLRRDLKTLLERRNTINGEITKLNQEVLAKRELFLKVQGIIEYLSEIGVTLEEPQSSEETPPQEDPEIEG